MPVTSLFGHQLPPLGCLLRPVHSALAPHPTCPFQLVSFLGVTPTFGLPHLVTRLHQVLNEVELVAQALDTGSAHVNGHRLDALEMPVVLMQFSSEGPKTDVSLPGVAKITLLVIRSANTVR